MIERFVDRTGPGEAPSRLLRFSSCRVDDAKSMQRVPGVGSSETACWYAGYRCQESIGDCFCFIEPTGGGQEPWNTSSPVMNSSTTEHGRRRIDIRLVAARMSWNGICQPWPGNPARTGSLK